MRGKQSRLQPTQAQDWSSLRVGDEVIVHDARGSVYKAAIESKALGSEVVWIQRQDTGTRHLIEYRDGVVLRHVLANETPAPRRRVLQQETFG